jgi:hypothetical protein
LCCDHYQCDRDYEKQTHFPDSFRIGVGTEAMPLAPDTVLLAVRRCWDGGRIFKAMFCR